MNVLKITVFMSLVCLGMKIPNTAAQEKKGQITLSRTILIPEFYKEPFVRNDTTFSYEFLDKHDLVIPINNIRDINDIEDINYIMSFSGGSGSGNISGPYLSVKLVSYNKLNEDTWGVRDRINNGYTQVKEHKNKISRTDTAVVTDFKTKEKLYVLRKFYKVTASTGKVTPPPHTHDHAY